VKNSIIIPAFNEEEGLPLVLKDIFSVIDDTFEVIVVDDGSTDCTREVAKEFPCKLVCRDGERGKGRALRTGIANAQGENVIWIDADATYPVEVIPEMAAVLATHDMVVCSRTYGREHIPIMNRIGNAILTKLTQKLYGFKPSDPCSGAYGVKKRHLEKMELTSNGFGIEAEVALKSARMGLRTVELFLDYRPRVGKTKLSGLRDGYIILKTIIGSLLIYNPTLLFTVPGSLLAITGIALIAWFLAKPMPMLDKPQEFVIMVSAVLASLIGMHIAIFGIAVQLYASVHRFATPGRLTRFLFAKHGRQFLVVAGIVGVCTGLGLLLVVIPYEIPHGTVRFVDLYEDNKLIIPALVAGLFGVEIVLLALFVSVFRPKQQ
jgi:glycosyltransferase involved in cell wall biosynthesis